MELAGRKGGAVQKLRNTVSKSERDAFSNVECSYIKKWIIRLRANDAILIELLDSNSNKAISNFRSDANVKWWIGECYPSFKNRYSPSWIKNNSDLFGNLVLQASYSDRYGDFSPTLATRSRYDTYKYDKGYYLTIKSVKKNNENKQKVNTVTESSSILLSSDNTLTSVSKVINNNEHEQENDKNNETLPQNEEHESVQKDNIVVEDAFDITHQVEVVQNDEESLDKEYYAHSIPVPPQQHSQLSWYPHLIHYESNYFVPKNKFQFILQKLKNEMSLCIFLSSPFNGCEYERKLFMESKVPILESMCQEKGVYLSVIDMRFGITDTMSKENKTILACLRAIDRSDIFLGYFGARYGSSILVPNSNWILDSIQLCAESIYPYLEQYKDRSVTELEWLHGFLHDTNYERDDKPISFFYYRDVEYDKRQHDPVKYAVENEESKAAAERLKQRVIALTTPTRNSVHSISSHHDAKNSEVLASTDEQQYGALFDHYPNPTVGSDLMYSCCETLVRDLLAQLPASNRWLCFAICYI